MRVKRVEYGSAPECKGEENGRPPIKPADQWYRQARFPRAKIRERPRRESSPVRRGWRASSLTTRPPRPPRPRDLTLLDTFFILNTAFRAQMHPLCPLCVYTDSKFAGVCHLMPLGSLLLFTRSPMFVYSCPAMIGERLFAILLAFGAGVRRFKDFPVKAVHDKISSQFGYDRPIMNAVKYKVVSSVVWTNRTMVSSNTDTNRTGVLAVVDIGDSLKLGMGYTCSFPIPVTHNRYWKYSPSLKILLKFAKTGWRVARSRKLSNYRLFTRQEDENWMKGKIEKGLKKCSLYREQPTALTQHERGSGSPADALQTARLSSCVCTWERLAELIATWLHARVFVCDTSSPTRRAAPVKTSNPKSYCLRLENAAIKGRVKTGDPRENSPTSGIVQHDSHYENPGATPQESNPVRLGGRSEIGSKIDTEKLHHWSSQLKFISNRRNWWFEISIRDQKPSSTNIDESEIQKHGILLVQHFHIGTWFGTRIIRSQIEEDVGATGRLLLGLAVGDALYLYNPRTNLFVGSEPTNRFVIRSRIEFRTTMVQPGICESLCSGRCPESALRRRKANPQRFRSRRRESIADVALLNGDLERGANPRTCNTVRWAATREGTLFLLTSFPAASAVFSERDLGRGSSVDLQCWQLDASRELGNENLCKIRPWQRALVLADIIIIIRLNSRMQICGQITSGAGLTSRTSCHVLGIGYFCWCGSVDVRFSTVEYDRD
ncbi:hypothetical protein PR048_032327 [Dryococelus australis]|uniref:Uncharacterized protein n=1 Tax=Dryococelus australis TaxID=614101 RepID=A0ABQ9G1W9_9NEOP|nr:hypothetical protein PR048_032327 [Dryococelus australis]